MKKQNKSRKPNIIHNDNKSQQSKNLGNNIQCLSKNVEFGKILKYCRHEAGLTQAEISKATGIHKPNISRLEHSKSNISIDSLVKYLDILDKQIEFRLVSKN